MSGRPGAAGQADPADAAIRDVVNALLDARRAGATVCPSEVARQLAGADADADVWRALMPSVRRVAAVMAAQGQLRVTRQGADVDATAGGGPVRLGRPG